MNGSRFVAWVMGILICRRWLKCSYHRVGLEEQKFKTFVRPSRISTGFSGFCFAIVFIAFISFSIWSEYSSFPIFLCALSCIVLNRSVLRNNALPTYFWIAVLKPLDTGFFPCEIISRKIGMTNIKPKHFISTFLFWFSALCFLCTKRYTTR